MARTVKQPQEEHAEYAPTEIRLSDGRCVPIQEVMSWPRSHVRGYQRTPNGWLPNKNAAGQKPLLHPLEQMLYALSHTAGQLAKKFGLDKMKAIAIHQYSSKYASRVYAAAQLAGILSAQAHNQE